MIKGKPITLKDLELWSTAHKDNDVEPPQIEFYNHNLREKTAEDDFQSMMSDSRINTISYSWGRPIDGAYWHG